MVQPLIDTIFCAKIFVCSKGKRESIVTAQLIIQLLFDVGRILQVENLRFFVKVNLFPL